MLEEAWKVSPKFLLAWEEFSVLVCMVLDMLLLQVWGVLELVVWQVLELLVWGELECRLLNLREVGMCPWGLLAMLFWLVLDLLFKGVLESETLVWDFLEDWWQAGDLAVVSSKLFSIQLELGSSEAFDLLDFLGSFFFSAFRMFKDSFRFLIV